MTDEEREELVAKLRAMGCTDIKVGPGGISGRGPEPRPPGRVYISPTRDEELHQARMKAFGLGVWEEGYHPSDG